MKVRATLASGLLLASTLGFSLPAHAQSTGNQGGANTACTSDTTGDSSASGAQANRSQSGAILPAVIAAAVQDVSVLSDLNANLNTLNDTNVNVVCLNDVLNQNDVHILNDVLNDSPILSGDLNNSLNNVDVLNELAQNANVNVLDNTQVLAVNFAPDGNTLYLLHQ